MHAAILFVGCWAVAIIALGIAVVLLNIFYGLIGNDLELRSIGQEAAVAGVASFIEAVGFWLILSFVPTASRAMIIPALIVAFIYKIAHLEDWSRYDIFMLLVFQTVIGFFGVSLFFGHLQTAIIILFGFGIVLAIIAGVAKSL